MNRKLATYLRQLELKRTTDTNSMFSYPDLPRTAKAGSDGVYTTEMAQHAGTKVKRSTNLQHTSISLYEEQSTSVTMTTVFN